MGSCIGSFHARIPLLFGCGPVDHQGRYYAGCCGAYSRRLGQDLAVARSVTSDWAAEIISQRLEGIGPCFWKQPMSHLFSTVVRCWGTRPTLRLGGYLCLPGLASLRPSCF